MNGITKAMFPLVTALTMSLWLTACTGESQVDAEGTAEASHAEEAGEHAAAESGSEHAEGGEHGEEGGHDEEGEESGVFVGAGETWDVARRGARLVLSFDPDARAFVGTVENTSPVRICAVRVEVHLSTGTELGPTARVDLDPGQTTSVTLSTEGQSFGSFTAHSEMSPCGDS